MNRLVRPPLLSAVALGLAAVSPTQSLLQQYGEVVQGSGESVAVLPGVTIDVSAATGIPNMDRNGNLIWRAKLAGAVTAGVDDQAIFYGRNASDVQLVVRRGGPEPTGTLPGVTVTYTATAWDVPRLSPDNSFLLFGSSLAGTGVTTTNDTCLFWGTMGSLLVLAREGDAAPSGGSTFSGNISGALNATGINSTGTAICKVHLVGGDVVTGQNDDALLIGTPGTLGWLCREGDPINGGLQAVGALDALNSNLDETGRVVFAQPLSQTLGITPASATDDTTLMLYAPATGLSIVVREGDFAPGSGGCQYGTFSSSAMSKVALSRASGRIVFTNSMTGGNVTSNTDDTAIFAGMLGGGFERIAREGEAAPTGVPGEIYQAFFTSGQPAINENGTVVFVAQLGPTGLNMHSDVAVFVARPPYVNPGDVQMIVREGQAVAGLPLGWIIDNTSGGGMSSSGTKLMLNDRDVVLIDVAGVGDPTQANWGVPAVVAWDAQHGARAVYVQGDTFTVAGSAWTTTSAANWNIASNGGGAALQFNNDGDVCVKLFNGSQNAVVRGHVGAMICEPASVPAAGGVPHNFHLDCGPGHANEFYLIIASASGTSPGFPNPLNVAQTVPLNLDAWTQLSLSLADSAVWQNTFWFTDANGASTANFTLPAGYASLAGTQLHHAAVLFSTSLVGTFVTEPSAVRID